MGLKEDIKSHGINKLVKNYIQGVDFGICGWVYVEGGGVIQS